MNLNNKPPEHPHRLRNYKFRNQKQWNCIVPFCKFFTRNQLDLLGSLFACCNCGNLYRFENEDLNQRDRDIQCPICISSKDNARIIETSYINSPSLAQEHSHAPSVILDMNEVDPLQAADIVIADLIKEQLEK